MSRRIVSLPPLISDLFSPLLAGRCSLLDVRKRLSRRSDPYLVRLGRSTLIELTLFSFAWLMPLRSINLGLEYEPTSAELLAFRDEIEAARKAEAEEMRKEEEAL